MEGEIDPPQSIVTDLMLINSHYITLRAILVLRITTCGFSKFPTVGREFGRSTNENIVRSRELASYTTAIAASTAAAWWLGAQFIRIAEKCLWDVAFRWRMPARKFRKPCFMRNEVSHIHLFYLGPVSEGPKGYFFGFTL